MINERVGVMASLKDDGTTLKYVADLGLSVCQMVCWDRSMFSDGLADGLKTEISDTGVGVTSLWVGSIRNNVYPVSEVAAETMIRSARCASSTCSFSPVSSKPSRDFFATVAGLYALPRLPASS